MFKMTIIVLAIATSISIQAQNSWNDYIIGRPMAGYAEAKKATAEEWGINYNADFAGCVIDAEIEKKARDYEKSNAVYFKEIESKFGKDWLRYFNLDVQKKMLIAESETDSSYWVEMIVGKPNIAYFELKEKVARTWGIKYKANFAGCDLTAALKNRIENGELDEETYKRRIAARFGENWETDLEDEIKLEQAKKDASTSSNDKTAVWKEYVKGKPDTDYFDAKKAMAATWGIGYEAVFMGCKCNNKIKAELKKMEGKNKTYFAQLEEQYGADWKLRFEIATQKAFAKKL